MRPALLSLCLACLLGACLFASGCATQWTNPDIQDSAQTKSKFQQDSQECDLMAGEQYPLDKDKQFQIYSKCMNDKGWVKRDGDGYRFNTGKH
jgi:hypothetical protein